MKRFILIFFALLFCKITPGKLIITDELEYKLDYSIESYYFSMLKYPETVDELFQFIWAKVNHWNGNRFENLDELLAAKDVFRFYSVGGYELLFLKEYKDEIEISVNGNSFQLKFRNREVRMEHDYCEGIAFNLSYYFLGGTSFCYGIDGKLTLEQYKDELNSLKRKVSVQYEENRYTTMDYKSMRYSLLKYNKGEEKMQSMCNEEEIDFDNSAFLKSLHFSLDTFVAKREDIHSILLVCF